MWFGLSFLNHDQGIVPFRRTSGALQTNLLKAVAAPTLHKDGQGFLIDIQRNAKVQVSLQSLKKGRPIS